MNNKGFALQDLLFFISLFLIILVVCVIVIDSNISKFNDNIEEPKNVSEINEEKNDDKVEKVEESKKLTDYDILLEKMINTAKIYVTTNYTGKTDQIIIKTSKLVADQYMEDLIDPKDKENKCIGYIIYDGDSSYTPYLRCGNNFKSENYNESFE